MYLLIDRLGIPNMASVMDAPPRRRAMRPKARAARRRRQACVLMALH